MTNTAHTPTPWELRLVPKLNSEKRKHERRALCAGNLHICEIGIYDAEAEANAAFIVKAVNCHKQLVEALKQAKITLQEKGHYWVDMVAEQIDEAIAAAEAQ